MIQFWKFIDSRKWEFNIIQVWKLILSEISLAINSFFCELVVSRVNQGILIPKQIHLIENIKDKIRCKQSSHKNVENLSKLDSNLSHQSYLFASIKFNISSLAW